MVFNQFGLIMTLRILALIVGLAAGNALPIEHPFSTIQRDFKHSLRTAGALIQAPLHFTNRQWLTTAGVLGVTAGLFVLDQDVRKFSQERRHQGGQDLFKIDQYYGNGYTVLFTGGLYGVGLLCNKPGLRMAGLRATEAMVYASLLTGAGKFILGRRRPFAGYSQLVFKPLQLDYTYQALPSGHTTAAVAVATVLAKSIDRTWWKVFCYGAAATVGAARIYHNSHWLSDVFLGAAVGHAVALKVLHRDVMTVSVNSKYRLLPCVSRQGVGLTLTR